MIKGNITETDEDNTCFKPCPNERKYSSKFFLKYWKLFKILRPLIKNQKFLKYLPSNFYKFIVMNVEVKIKRRIHLNVHLLALLNHENVIILIFIVLMHI